MSGARVYVAMVLSARRAELLAALADLDRGDGCLGVCVDHALLADPEVTAPHVRAVVEEAEADAAVERARSRVPS